MEVPAGKKRSLTQYAGNCKSVRRTVSEPD